MRWRCTVVRGDGTSTDLEVRAARSTPTRHVAHAVAAAAATDPARLHVSGRALDDHLQLGWPPLVHGAVLTAGPGAPRPSRCVTARHGGSGRDGGAVGLLELRVVGGPDSGSIHRLGPGAHRVGRAPGCEVRVEDAACSRVHAVLDVAGDGVEVRDAGSTNGTTVDGVPVDVATEGEPSTLAAGAGSRVAAGSAATRRGTRLGVGARLRVGDTTLEVHPVTDDPAPLRRCGDGTLAVRRSARRRPPAPERVVTLPEPPTPPARARVPWVGAALPLVVSVPLAFWWGPVALLIGLTGPLVVLGSAWHDRRAARVEHAAALAEHTAAAAAADLRLGAALRDEVADRRAAAPDPAALGRRATGRTRQVWERGRDDDDVLVLRLGTGRVAARTRCRAVEDRCGTPVLDDAPVTLPLATTGVLGVAGPAPLRRAVLRWLVAQVAVLHSPVDVRLHVVTTGADGWAWTGWLPHAAAVDGGCTATVAADRSQAARRVDDLARLVRDRASRAFDTDLPWVVLLLDGARRLADVPGLATVLTQGPAVRVVTICGDTARAGLPAECAAVATADAAGRLRLRAGIGPDHADVVPDGVGTTWCEAAARGLAPLRDETAAATAGGLPASVHLVDLLSRTGLDATDAEAVARSWRRHPRTTHVVLGCTPAGPWTVDLRTDGPHVLVGGTTGAGKSELLQTLVASLALANRPEEMSFVLVDFKGGAAFGACAALPHTAGLVTDLDAHLTARALASLAAEVRRRERVLAGAGVADLEAYQRIGGREAGPPLARLVIVVDEYRALAEELPDLMDSLVRLAAVGRSLGIHLVLATQRPAGVVGADLRANVNLRIALRVRDAADSTDVVESPAAAALDPGAPGRAVARTGGGPLVPVQVARVAGHRARRVGQHVEVRRLGWATLGDPPGADTPGQDAPPPGRDRPEHVARRPTAQQPTPQQPTPQQPTPQQPTPQQPPAQPAPAPTASDLASVVQAVREAAALVAARPPAGPWLPPLPDVLPWAGGPGWPDGERGGPASPRTPGRVGPVLTLGVVDLPSEQTTAPLQWDLAAGSNVVVAGSPRSGRTGVVRAVLASVAGCPPDAVHVHLLTGGSAPSGLEGLPHVGTVAGPDDPVRSTRLLERLAEEIARRRGGSPGRADRHRVLLVVDDGEQLLPALEAHDGGRGTDLLLDVLRAGPGAGVLTLLAGDRSVLTGRLAGVAPQRWLLRLADPTDLLLAGVPARSVPARQPPGRLLRLGPDGMHEAQVLDVDDAALATALGAAARSGLDPRPARDRPLRVERLPDQLTLTRLLQAGADGPPPGADSPTGDGEAVLIGLGGPDATPVGLDLRAAAALVAGVAGSGRSTVLHVAAAVVRRRGGRVVAVRPGPVAGRAAARVPAAPGSGPSGRVIGPLVRLDGTDPGALREALDPRHGATLVVVDDVALIQDRPAEDVLLQVADSWDSTGSGLLVAGAAASLAGRYRGLAALARRSGCGVLLGAPAPADGDLLSVTLPRTGPGPPGRGLLVRHGAVQRVQVADADR